jgi:hypothetical protein
MLIEGQLLRWLSSADQYWVDNFNAGNYALIMAKAVGSSSDGTPTYNVVAQTYGAST